MEVACQKLLHIRLIIIGIDCAHGYIHDWVTHAGILPIQKFYTAILKKQEVIHIGINMAQAFGAVHGVHTIHEPIHPLPHLLVVLKKVAAMAAAQLFIKINPLTDVKVMSHRDA